MTNEYALWLLNQLMIGASVDAKPIIPQYELAQALDLAIKALKQQSTDTKTYLKRQEENYVEYNVEWFLKNWELELEILSGGKIKPTDAVSRSDLMKLYKEWQPRLATNVYEFGQALAALPPVTPQTVTEFADKCKECGKIQNELSEDVVNREAVNALVDELARAISDERCCISRGRSTATIMRDILHLPSVTPQRPKGKWIRVVDKAGHWVWECNCKWQQRFATNYCPNCGADMRGKEDED